MAAYLMILTESELFTLQWPSAHGYDAGLLEASNGIPDPSEQGMFLLEWDEHKAWEVVDAYNEDPYAYGAGGSGTGPLGEKMADFINAIV